MNGIACRFTATVEVPAELVIARRRQRLVSRGEYHVLLAAIGTVSDGDRFVPS